MTAEIVVSLGKIGAAVSVSLAAVGSALGTGAAGMAAVGAWKKCYAQKKLAPFLLVAFVGAPITQTFYGLIVMITLNGKAEGGVYPGLVPTLTSQYGLDVIYAAGSGIHGHPDGTTEGCKAFREMFDLIVDGKEIDKEATSATKALSKAIDTWGLFKRPMTPFDGLYNKWSIPKK